MKTLRCFLRFCMVGLALGLLIVGLTGCGEKKEDKGSGPRREEAVKVERTGFSKEVRQVIEKRLKFIKKLAGDPLIIKAVREFNQKNRDINTAEILRLDDQWKKARCG